MVIGVRSPNLIEVQAMNAKPLAMTLMLVRAVIALAAAIWAAVTDGS